MFSSHLSALIKLIKSYCCSFLKLIDFLRTSLRFSRWHKDAMIGLFSASVFFATLDNLRVNSRLFEIDWNKPGRSISSLNQVNIKETGNEKNVQYILQYHFTVSPHQHQLIVQLLVGVLFIISTWKHLNLQKTSLNPEGIPNLYRNISLKECYRTVTRRIMIKQ